MNGPSRAPGPLLAFATGTCALAFTTDHPLLVGALLIGAIALQRATPLRGRVALVMAAVIGLGVALLNPFVQANGDLILVELPDIPIFDLQVTLEELVAGAVLGMRAAAVTLVVVSVLAIADPDRLLALASRLMPRSALAASIAARMAPTLSRDARGLAETAQLRGRSLTDGNWRDRARVTGALAVPLVGSALERSVDVAEAMAARGYGAGRATRMPTVRWRGADRVVAACALALAGIAVATASGAVGDFRTYPTLGAVLAPADVATAAAAVGAMLVASRWCRR